MTSSIGLNRVLLVKPVPHVLIHLICDSAVRASIKSKSTSLKRTASQTSLLGLRQDVVDDFSVDVGKTEVATLEAVRETLVIDAE